MVRIKYFIGKSFLFLLILFAGLLVFTSFPDFRYLRKVLTYFTPDIDDSHIFDHRTITADAPQAWPISDRYNRQSIPAQYLPDFEKYGTVAYLIVKDSALLFEQYWDGYDEHSLVNSFSVSKSIVSLLAGIARDEGKIADFDLPVAAFYPPFADGERKNITVRHLLTMSSGLDWDESYNSPFSVTTKAYYGENLEELVSGLRAVEQPGQIFRYKSGVTLLLSFVVANAVGQSIGEYASEKLWTPIGAEHDARWSLDRPEGVEKAYCCFNSNARDFARIGQLVLNRGKWNGVQVVSASFIDEATQPAVWLHDEDTGQPVDFYGYQWWRLRRNDTDIIYARGLLGQYILVAPDQNMVIVRLGLRRSDTQTEGHYPLDVETWLDAAFQMYGEQ
jgi:CubicO group peptidase (beta-lactamase class C family)